MTEGVRLTARDLEILNELRGCHEASYPLAWARPLDVGAYGNSDHSARLSKMARYGLVESKQRSAHMSRGSKVYRITEAGRAALLKGED